MATTLVLKGNQAQLKTLDTDWTLADNFTTDSAGWNVKSIQFDPQAASDATLILRSHPNGIASVASAPVIFSCVTADVNDQRIKYFGGGRGVKMWPIYDQSEQGSVSASAILTIELA